MRLVNPYNGSPLHLQDGAYVDETGRRFPVTEGVVRVAEDQGYADNFGFQWSRFATTQLELTVSRDRFFASTAWRPEDLAGLAILEVGCGAGRFSRVVLEETQAQLFSVDYSRAVWVNRRNHPGYVDRFQLFQASLYDLPFPAGSFDAVFCFGVLQHTPDFRKSIESLATMVKPGGSLVVDFYPIRGWWTKLHAKYLLRPLSKRLPHRILLRWIEANIDWLLLASEWAHRVGLGKLTRFLPVCDVRGTFPPGLTAAQIREMAVLDTFDMFSPEHDHPQRIRTVARWFRESGMQVTLAGEVAYPGGSSAVVRGVRS